MKNIANILSMKKLLSRYELVIPDYQRPYKWTDSNVLNLISDISNQMDKPSYRLGTVVLFKEKDNKFSIVDGQQRIISILLILLAYSNSNKFLNKHSSLNGIVQPIINGFQFVSTTSKANIKDNYQAIEQEIKKPEFQSEFIDFLLSSCEIVVVVLDEISEAFQFFDAQNARGKDLEPHDLLKAFHLREFSAKDGLLMGATVKHWEDTDTNELKKLFSIYLYCIRGWIKGKSSRVFSKSEIGLFKGVTIENTSNYPFIMPFCYLNNYVEQKNNKNVEYPFQLDQVIINGKRFFEMIAHYGKLIDKIDFLVLTQYFKIDEQSQKILSIIDDYSKLNRTGDIYALDLFKSLLIFYIDKFGAEQLSDGIRKIFIWAYSLRLQYEKLYFASMDNYVLDKNMFVILSESYTPKDFLNTRLPVITEVKATKADKLKEIFDELGYIKNVAK